MSFNNETLYLYSLLFRVGLINFTEFGVWLDNEFLQDTQNQNDLLIELEYATNDQNKTLHILDEYLADKASHLDFSLLGKMLIKNLKNLYMENKYSVEELAHDIYGMWNHLPYDIGNQEPFHMMSYIDDPLSYGAKAQTVTLLEQFLDYYESH